MIRVREIIDVSAAVAGLRVQDMLARDHHQVTARPRLRAMFLARRLRPELSYLAISREFAGRHHTTVMAAERRVEGRLVVGEPAELEAVRLTLARLGFEPDLDAAIAAVQRSREVIARRRDLEARRTTLRDQLAAVERQLALLTAGLTAGATQ